MINKLTDPAERRRRVSAVIPEHEYQQLESLADSEQQPVSKIVSGMVSRALASRRPRSEGSDKPDHPGEN